MKRFKLGTKVRIKTAGAFYGIQGHIIQIKHYQRPGVYNEIPYRVFFEQQKIFLSEYKDAWFGRLELEELIN